jgi:hypothetical protein
MVEYIINFLALLLALPGEGKKPSGEARAV